MTVVATEIEIWWIPFALASAAPPCLSDDERARAARFVRERDRARFAAFHGGLRRVLARYLERAPETLAFVTDAHGKPRLADASLSPGSASGGVRFNLSHSHDLAVVAVARGRELGVDVERLDPSVEHRALSERFFSPAERAELAAIDDDRVCAAFFACWTRKEAFVKAVGRGLALGLDTFDVAVAPDAAEPLLRAVRDDALGARSWTIAALDAPAGYAAALAVDAATLAGGLRHRRFEELTG